MSMSGIVAEAADAVTAAFTSRAVEPAAGDAAADGHTHEANCLNCGTRLVGSHCHACGQHAHVHKTIGAFFHDLLHGVFHFEGKIWRTVPQLAIHPGRMTREYIDGRRASYVSPIALFLFSVFLLFAAVKGIGAQMVPNPDVSVNGKAIKGLAANEAEIAKLKAQRKLVVAQKGDTEKLDAEIEARESAIETLRDIRDGFKEAQADAAGEAAPNPTGKASTGAGGLKSELDAALKQGDKTKHYSDIPALDEAIAHARENPQLVLYKAQTNAYKYAWALIPISVLFVWMMFPFSRRFGLYDHTVFVTYSLSAMSLLFVAAALLRAASLPGTLLLLTVLPVLHLYRHVKGTYGLSRFGAVWRTWWLMISATIALSLFAMFIAAESGGA